ncbi:GNAT family N-acetyltransferase [Celerinatantimonas sp. YJH-8]|uniref:GNAT family N-acetyltransferase n=1 Tax=Celerinatantimonas sp. YJH-8 TaxID=3228714 RepID=UPI0038C59054
MEVITSHAPFLEQLIHWPTDAEQLHLFAGPGLRWPLTVEQLIQSEQTGYAGMLVEGELLLGYFQLKMRSPEICRLCRVIIHPRYRGQRLGRMMLAHAILIARDHYHAKRIELGVYQHNLRAMNRYLYFGFRPMSQSMVRGPGHRNWIVVEMYKILGKTCIDIQV